MTPKEAYQKGETVLFSEPMTEGTKKVLKAFLRKLKNEDGLKYLTLKNYTDTLIVFIRILNKKNGKLREIDSLDSEDIYVFLEELDDYTYISHAGKVKSYKESTKQRHRLLIKVFLKFLKKDDLVDMIKVDHTTNDRLPEDLLTPEEVDKLIEAADNPRDQAFIAALYESGARIGEMLACNINSLVFDENGCIITIPEGKTGARRIRVVNSASYLKMWRDSHPLKNQPDAPLWLSARKPYRTITVGTANYMLREVAATAGITKKVNPHAFRHAAATKLAQHLTEQQMKIYLGWAKGSDMPAIYVHLSGKDVDDAILKMNGQEPEDVPEVMVPGKCPRCKEMNHHSAPTCWKCGFPLKKGAEQRLGADLSEADAIVMQTMMDDPAFAAKVCEIAKRITMSNQLK